MTAESEAEALRAAKFLIEKYGRNAGRQAQFSLIDAWRGGDAEIIAHWRNVISAIRKLQP